MVTKVKEITEASASVGLLLATAVGWSAVCAR